MSEQLCPDQSAKIHTGFTWLIKKQRIHLSKQKLTKLTSTTLIVTAWKIAAEIPQRRIRNLRRGGGCSRGEFHPVEISLRWHSVAEGECCLISICEGGGEFY